MAWIVLGIGVFGVLCCGAVIVIALTPRSDYEDIEDL